MHRFNLGAGAPAHNSFEECTFGLIVCDATQFELHGRQRQPKTAQNVPQAADVLPVCNR